MRPTDGGIYTYHGDNLFLHKRREGHKLEEEGEIDLECKSAVVLFLLIPRGTGHCKGGGWSTYGAHEEGEGDGLLGARHGGQSAIEQVDSSSELDVPREPCEPVEMEL